ncbi:MAG: chorismate mutase [Gemmatimonadaceae bacterium]
MPVERRYWAVRGATTVERDDPALIARAVHELLAAIETLNALTPDLVVSALFTMTADLRSEFPARAARHHGWDEVAMLSTVEIPVPGSLERCIRTLVHVEFPAPRERVHHVYLHAARALRVDLPPSPPASAGG